MSFDIPEYTGDVTGLGTVRILEAIRETGPKAKFYQASSSEFFFYDEDVDLSFRAQLAGLKNVFMYLMLLSIIRVTPPRYG